MLGAPMAHYGRSTSSTTMATRREPTFNRALRLSVIATASVIAARGPTFFQACRRGRTAASCAIFIITNTGGCPSFLAPPLAWKGPLFVPAMEPKGVLDCN